MAVGYSTSLLTLELYRTRVLGLVQRASGGKYDEVDSHGGLDRFGAPVDPDSAIERHSGRQLEAYIFQGYDREG